MRNNDWIWMWVALGMIIGAGLATFVWATQVMPEAVQAETHRIQREAVKARAGKWVATEDGSPTFAWTTCTVLGTTKQ